MNNTYTKHTAIDSMMHMPRTDLAELCYEAHKDQYGISGHHLLSKPVPELVSWYISHYTFNEDNQWWESTIPFGD